jgi:hypothetical protein
MSWGNGGGGNASFASEQTNKVTQTVTQKLTSVRNWATSAQTTANGVINGLNKFTEPVINMTFPTTPKLDAPVQPATGNVHGAHITINPKTSGFTNGGQISFSAPTALPVPTYGMSFTGNSRPSISIPAAPVPTLVAAPTLPAAPILSKPTAPTFGQIAKPGLIAINIPEFSFDPIEPFAGTIPEYTPPVVTIGASVQLAEYDPSALQARIDALMPKELPPDYLDLCKKLTDELVGAVDKEIAKGSGEAFDKWASLNFSMTPGMLVSDINDIQAAGGVKIREGQAKLNDEFFKLTFENLKTAVAQGIAIEKHLIDIYVEEVRQLLEIEKLKVKATISTFDTVVAAFNAHQSARALYATAYKVELEGNLRVIESYAPLVEGAIAEIAENEVSIGMFSADAKLQGTIADVYKTGVQALSADVEVYRATLSGVKAEADIIAANISAYKDAVRAYAAGIDASSAEFGAYAAEVKAASSVLSVDEANVRAYATYIQEASKQTGVYRAFTSGQSEVLQAELSAFKSASSANEHYARAMANLASSEAEVGMAGISSYSAQVRAATDFNKAVAQKTAADVQFGLIAKENDIRQNLLNVQIKAETDKLNAGVKAAQAQALASLAQGSMSAMHVQASAQGSGTTAFSANYNYGVNSSWGGTVDKSDVKRRVLSA